jgi:hypothetical protein
MREYQHSSALATEQTCRTLLDIKIAAESIQYPSAALRRYAGTPETAYVVSYSFSSGLKLAF